MAVILSAAKDLSRGAPRCFAALSMTTEGTSMTQLGNGVDAFWATLVVALRGGGVLPQIHHAPEGFALMTWLCGSVSGPSSGCEMNHFW